MVVKHTHPFSTVNPFIHARTIKDFSFLTQDRLDVHVPAHRFPALIRIKLEMCLVEAKKRVSQKTALHTP
jgi:hypothetical protein